MDEATNEASLDHEIPQKPFESTIGKYIDESVYRAIGTRLNIRQHYCDNWTKYSEHWNRASVRLYTLLRMLGFKDGDTVFKRFECENVDDFWLPLNNSILRKIKPEALPEAWVLEFAKAQSYIMSDSKQMDEANLVRPFFERQYNQDKRRSRPRHRHIEHGIDHFADMGQIGEGSSANVRRFRHEDSGKDSGRDFACKRLLRVTYTNLENQRNQLEYFKKEIEALASLEYHRHIVSLVASFTDLESFSLILYPIADKVLLDLLKQTDPLSEQDVATLRNSFNCLATALEFLHAMSIRHKDIKPSNILLSDGRVLLCDFGISHRWTDSENGTTEGGYSSFTHRYAAPEVLRVDASRNSKADIWSLGCVFLEILSVLKGCSFDQIMKGRGLSYSLVQEYEMSVWRKKINLDQDDIILNPLMDCVLMMIRRDPKQRLDAGTLVNKIHDDAKSSGLTAELLASCCRRVDAEPHSRHSYNSVQNITPYVEPGNQSGIIDPASDNSSARSHRHGSLVSSQSQRSSGPVRNSNIISNPATPVAPQLPGQILEGAARPTLPSSARRNLERVDLPFRVTQGRSSLSTVPVSARCSTAQTPDTTPGTSVRSNSACYEQLTVPKAAAEVFSVETIHNHRVVWPITHGSPCGIRADETLLFTNLFMRVSITESATVERYSQCCNTAENTVQIFETARINDDPPVWGSTRRLVLSDFTPSSPRICYSFWLPLTNIEFSCHDAIVTLRWSDCNHLHHIQDRMHGRAGHWSWTYDPAVANNEICIRFGDTDAAKEFIDTVRFFRDGGSMLEVSDELEIQTWHDNYLQSLRKPFVATHHDGTSYTSRLYVIGRYIDPLIRLASPDDQFYIQLNRIECLNYLSNLRNQTSRGRRIARFETTKLIPTSLTLTVPQFPNLASPIPPGSITTLFRRLTGWKLQFCTTVLQVNLAPFLVLKSFMPKHLWKHYGTADVMLWRRDAQDMVSASITFRLPGDGNIWMSVTTSTSKDHESKNAIFTFNMFGKQRGRLLDTTSMKAVPEDTLNDPSSTESRSDEQKELRRVELRFQNLYQRQAFEGLFEDLACSVSEDQPRLRARTSLAMGSLIPGTPMGR